jgi:hypothetical protein
MPNRFPRLASALAVAMALARPLPAQEPIGNALMLFDSYLAQAALINPAYRTDLKAGTETAPPPGRLLGESPILGPFTYRARTFGELTRGERADLLRDPGFRAFLITTSLQAECGGWPAIAAERTGQPPVTTFSVEPEEMLRPRAVRVILPSQ